MPGYVHLDRERELRSLTGGVLYDHRLALRLRTEGFEVECFDLDTLPRHAKLLKFPVTSRLRKIAGSFDVLLTDLGNSALTMGFQERASREGRLTVLICHHFRSGLEPSLLRRLMYRYSERKVVACAGILIANSPHTVGFLESMGRNREDIVLAPPGLSVTPVLEPVFRESPSRILSVCSIEPRKGVLEMVRALHGSGIPAATLTIAGDPRRGSVYSAEVERLISELGMGSRVFIAGRLSREDLMEEYSKADAFMLLSNWEGYGMAIAEAMASGLPVITTRAGAIPWLVQDGRNGILVEPGDWRAAAEGVRRMLTDGGLRMRLASEALKSAASFPSWDGTTGRSVEAISKKLTSG
ncbi:MAG: hypothetical protein AVO35_10890 [Candidatus Aegiribacteria sp. MLS_C]|nr:MAG: hypothetical protein AVO35_10890 [Candidatus Aegiribacteria sp. MLS_C]